METYKDLLLKAMNSIGVLPNSVFIGQQVLYKGNPMSSTLESIDESKRIEVPVFEETQMGMSLGLAASGHTVVTLYPRWDFLICSTNQLINHVDKWTAMTGDKNISLIIRVGKGSNKPLDPGHQHQGDYLNEFASMCKNITFHDLKSPSQIPAAYAQAVDQKGVHMLIEYPELYDATVE